MPGTGAQRAGAREAAPRYDDTWMQVQEGDGERDGDNDATASTNDEGNSEDGTDDDQDGDTAAESRPDIQARLRTRAPTDIYQAGTKKEAKKPGRGRGRR